MERLEDGGGRFEASLQVEEGGNRDEAVRRGRRRQRWGWGKQGRCRQYGGGGVHAGVVCSIEDGAAPIAADFRVRNPY